MVTASIRNNQLNLLGGRVGYNLALRHFRTAQSFSGDVGGGHNLADVLNAALDDDKIEEYQARPVVSLLLADKFKYAYQSQNLQSKIQDVTNLRKTVQTWTNIQVVLVYTDANDGIHVLNPEDPAPWEAALPLAKDEHIVCYAGSLDDVRPEVLESAAADVFALLYGDKIKSNSAYRSAKNRKKFLNDEPEVPAPVQVKKQKDAPQVKVVEAVPQPSGGSKKLTAKIAVNVTNELFHNGNVEAWKRIIESYKFKYPTLDVLIWYEGERINDINALFKWGKVKHGVPIMFSVAGDNPTDISKLRKYLFEGASQRFEAFLHGAHGSILQLF